MVTPIEVAAGLVFRQGRLLITQRLAQGHLPGVWEFPGGKRETDESFEQCLHRELMEELGIEVTVGRVYESMTYAYPEKTVRLQFFLCRWLQGDPQTLGCANFAWVEASDLSNYEFPAADARLLRRLIQEKAVWAEF